MIESMIERMAARSSMRSRFVTMLSAPRSASSPVPRARRHCSQSGYAYVMAMFLMLAMIASSEIALQNIVTTGRRQREEQTIWRGEQYIRAVRAYYRKTGHYPQSISDLETGLPDLHFLRLAAYKDPLNTSDGTWRFIYVNGGGQIIGSVRYGSLQQMAWMDMNGGQLPTTLPTGQLGVPASSLSSSSSATAPQPAQTPSSPGTPSTPGAPTTPGSPVDTSASATPNSTDATQTPGSTQSSGFATAALAGQPQPTGPVDGPVLGAFLTGVASKVDRTSVRVYKGGKKYNQWEFIWNPLEDQARAVQSGLSAPAAQPGQIGLPIGQVGGSATVPTATPTQSSPTQPQPPSP
jgi:hypothetical protein